MKKILTIILILISLSCNKDDPQFLIEVKTNVQEADKFTCNINNIPYQSDKFHLHAVVNWGVNHITDIILVCDTTGPICMYPCQVDLIAEEELTYYKLTINKH